FRSVSTYQAAMLAGLLKAPSRYNPLADPKQAQARTRQVLANMVNAGYLTEAGAARAMRRKSAVIDKIPAQRSARYFIDWVLAQIPSYVSPGHGDIVVETTLDPGLQRWTEAEVRAVIAESGRAARISEAALVALAPDGAVRIMIGGKRYANSQFNRAVQALRQPGSAFKPIVYLGALEQGLKPDTMLLDAPLDIGGWEPRNFDRRYRGNVTMRVALADSINTVAVRLGRKVGIDRLIKTARRLGITSPMRRDLSLALGAVEMSLLELTGAYAPFANGGAGVWPYAIRAIKSKDGRVLYERSGSGPGRVVKAEHVAAMNGMLAKVLIDGTGKHAKLDRPAAGKTGTSQNSRDAWFIGYTPQLIAGVWMGNDDGTPMQRVTGGGLPAVLWKRFMTHALDGAEERDLPGADPFEEKGFWERLFSSL
ncbi:MAG: penicillin-binding transpeptidase domain-containing protein, partial [Rhodospirillales bacterium]